MTDPSKLNWDRVFDVIQAQKIPDWDKELVALAVEKATKTWTMSVDKGMTVVSTEIFGDEPFPHKIDVLGSDDSSGRLKIIDWKTKRGGLLDDRWTLKKQRSWQMPLYASVVASLHGMDVFPILAEIRGIVLTEKPLVRTVPFVFTRADAEAAWNNLRQNEVHRQCLIDYGKIPWTKDPQGCRAFGDGYKCEFEGICWPGSDPMNPLIQIPTGDMTRASRPFSPSSMDEFRRCPERYRLMRVLDKEDDEDKTGAGNAFHAAMEEIYSQLKLVTDETAPISGASKEVDPK